MFIIRELVLLIGIVLLAIGASFLFIYSTATIRCLCATGTDCCAGYFAKEKIISISIMTAGIALLPLSRIHIETGKVQ